MPEMRKLYDIDPYAVEFDAVVTETAPADKESPGALWVTLDQTLFFPEEGGQSPDRGFLEELPVTDVQIEGETIRHLVVCGEKAACLQAGARVRGRIDWEHRFRNMQMHTGEHIFSGLVHRRFGYANVGFHLSDNSATMDYSGKLTGEELRELEEAANKAITDNLAVRAWYASAEELEELSYRSKRKIDGAVRLVEIKGVDLCACCAPHVRTTGEVGCFKVIDCENYKGGVRVSYRCGLRAMEDYEERLSLLRELSRSLSVKTERLAETVSALQEERKELSFRLRAKERMIVLGEIARSAAEDGRTRTEDGRVDGAGVLLAADGDPSILRFAADEMKKRYAGTVCVMVPVNTDTTPGTNRGSGATGVTACADTTPGADCGSGATGVTVWRYVIEHDGGDVSLWQTALRERFEVKGGGPANAVQGSVTAPRKDLALLLARLVREQSASGAAQDR